MLLNSNTIVIDKSTLIQKNLIEGIWNVSSRESAYKKPGTIEFAGMEILYGFELSYDGNAGMDMIGSFW